MAGTWNGWSTSPMSNTTLAENRRARLRAGVLAMALGLAAPSGEAVGTQEDKPMIQTRAAAVDASTTLTVRQQAIVPIAAFAAAGDMARLHVALAQGLDAGLTISDAKEILVQLYAYAGFPRSLNALGELMKVLDARSRRGIQDEQGRDPGRAVAQGEALLAAGTANQTRLSGGAVTGALFDFVPAIDQYLKTHLFGDIFERDNLDWQSRELATVGMLSALAGVEPQLQAHMRISMNVGLSAGQLRQLVLVLAERVSADAAHRAGGALDRQLAAGKGT